MVTRLIFAMGMAVGLMASAPAAAQDCDADHARTVSFAEATAVDAAAGNAALGSCIAIEGVVVGRLLVEDSAARYRRERRENDPSSTGAILGLYGVEGFDQPRSIRVMGVVSDCATAARTTRTGGPEVITELSGYCHYFNGRTLIAQSVSDIGPAQFARVRPSTAGAELGNLSPLADGDVRLQMLTAARRLIDAIRAGDRAAVAAMHGGGPNASRAPSELEPVNRLLFEDSQSPFASLRNSDNVVAIEIFGWREPLWADAQWRVARERTGTAEAIACFSAHANAAALWPIDSKDADNLPGRPYACSRVMLSGTGADAPASFDTQRARSGVAEPD